jgi:CHAD domain-containing protein
MDRVLEKLEQVRSGWDADDVHDLRVALRRCRSMSDALSEVNPGPGWRKLKKASREVFHTLGDLRDVQVERAWLKKLEPPGDPVRRHMLRLLSREETKYKRTAEQAFGRFDRKEWKKLTKKLAAKASFFPVESVVFQRLALSRLNRAVELYREARKRRTAASWHRLRIGVKNFRYIVENFLPQRSEVWIDDLKRMQDLLGDVHDMDVLRGRIRKEAPRLNPAAVAQWIERIDAERKVLLREFLAKTAGPESPWLTWRAGFQWGHALVAASFAQRRTA